MKKQGKPSEKASASSIEPRIEIDSEVTQNIRQHARAHSKTEVCGVLIGEFEDGAIDIRASIEGVNPAQAGTHVTFTQDAWEAIYRVKDERYPNERIVGWYHSHPGFGVFLSDHDLFIQQNFFSSPGQVAWVYDPHTDEEGCFGWVGAKSIACRSSRSWTATVTASNILPSAPARGIRRSMKKRKRVSPLLRRYGRRPPPRGYGGRGFFSRTFPCCWLGLRLPTSFFHAFLRSPSIR